jgi:hypothetical protein
MSRSVMIRSGGATPLVLAVVLAAPFGCGCGDDAGTDPDAAPADAAPEPLFPADYAETYTEVRDCRSSTSHDFRSIKVWADPAAAAPYLDRLEPFPVDSIVLKEEFDLGDVDCEGPIVSWTVMQRLAEGTAPALQLDWFWQRVDMSGAVETQNLPSCFGCHDDCDGNPGDSYQNTCAVP